jgi:RHS repeat-associated protein
MNSVTKPTVNTSTNRFSSSQGYSYDKNGNITGDVDPLTTHSRQFVFNGDNKQVQVNDTSTSTTAGTYAYDGNGKRVKKVTDAETTVFVYDGLGKLVAEYSTTTPPSNPTINYTATDQLGSPRLLTNSFGEVVSRRDFMPFGEDIYQNVGGRTSSLKYGSSTDDVRLKFTGYQKDAETSLDFAEARMYDNTRGRFTAVDPLMASGKSADPQTFDRYVYGMNNPLKNIDPSGMDTGIYFDHSGNYLGWDGKYDDNVYFATPTRQTEDSTYIDVNSISSTTLDAVQRAAASSVALSPGTETEAIHTFANAGDQGAHDVSVGLRNGLVNTITGSVNSNPISQITGIGLPTLQAENAKQAGVETAFKIGVGIGTAVAGTAVAPASSVSIAPEGEIFAPIKAGSVGGPTAGQRFPAAVRRQAFAENDLCVFCRGPGTELDHAIAASRGGNATIQNAQVACRFCNASKGAGTVPKNPAPGYEGPFPPAWWP